MSVFKPIKCTSSQLSSLAIVDGQFILTTDTNEMYLDNGTKREQYCSIDNNINDFNIFYWDGQSSDINPDNITLWQKIYNNRPAIVVCPDLNRKVLFLIEYMNFAGSYNYSSIIPYYSRETTVYGSRASLKHKEVTVTMTSGKVTNVSTLKMVSGMDIEYLSTHSTSNSYGKFTPTNDMHPTTKKYVDDSIKKAIGDVLGGAY